MIDKGQTGVEFIVSSVLFLVTISYASLTIINNIPVYHDYAVTENLISKSYQVSQYLVFDYLSAGSNYEIDENQITALEVLCNDRRTLVNQLGISDYDVIINIEKMDSTSLLNCETTQSQVSKEIIVRRYAVLVASGDVVRIEVSVV